MTGLGLPNPICKAGRRLPVFGVLLDVGLVRSCRGSGRRFDPCREQRFLPFSIAPCFFSLVLCSQCESTFGYSYCLCVAIIVLAVLTVPKKTSILIYSEHT